MIGLAVLLRFGADLALALAAGLTLLAALSRGQLTVRRALLAALAGAGALLTLGGLLAAARLAAPDQDAAGFETVKLLAFETWGGRVALVRAGLALAATAVFAMGGRSSQLTGLALIVAALILIPFSGHAVTAEPVAASLALHGLHAACVLLWAGGVVCLAVLAFRRGPAQLKDTLGRFSPVALGLVVLGIGTGVAAGCLQVASWAALLGTFYGQVLLVKAAVLLGVALACAAFLRWRFLGAGSRVSPRLLIGIEAAMCIGMLTLAAVMSQSVPGRHDDIVWPLTFRIDWRMLEADRDGAAALAGYLIFAGVMMMAALAGFLLRQRALAAAGFGAGALIGLLGLSNMIIPAYPTTFAVLQSTYSAETLNAAHQVFLDQCATCHGKTGHGDGFSMQMTGARAADLTAPHAGYHTAGDIFWWIGNGYPESVMEGVRETTTEAERWDLVNYVKLLGASAQSVAVTSEIAPGKPFLPSIDFSFTAAGGEPRRLRDLEGVSPVLLVLGREPGSLERLAELRKAAPAFAKSGLLAVFVAGPEIAWSVEEGAEPGLIVTAEGAPGILSAWSFYRRSAAQPDLDDVLPEAGHMEFLIDRFGYVRAKWRADESFLPAAPQVLADAAALAREPKLLPSPEEHLH